MLVEAQGLTKRYGGFTALSDCDLGIEGGEVFGLLGPNGAGKTTLLRLLMGFLRPTAGVARIGGLDCYRQRVQVHERVAYLPGDARLFRGWNGRQVLRFFAGIRPNGDDAAARSLAQRLDLDLSRRVAFMSTGMRQKLALAATLAADTPLVILDEPTSNLDPTVRATVLELIAQAGRRGRTVLLSSHVLSEVEEVCDRVVILKQGQLVHLQVMAELRRQHRIRAHLCGPLPPIPPDLHSRLSMQEEHGTQVTMDTNGDLSGLLEWLGTLPLDDLRVEPVGLRAVYDRYHRT